MRFIHTADWHLGKILKGVSLLEDQNYLLNKEFLKFVEDWKPDAIIIAGDIYDRGVPPTDAVDLFDEIIFKITEKKIPILCISGNHDNSARLNFGSRIFSQENFFITTKISENPQPVILEDNFGEIYFSLIPYFFPVELREIFKSENFPENFNHDYANKFYVSKNRKKIPANKRSIAIAHLFAAGGITSESERKFVGGVENISVENFSAYNYTALGHLHKPQNMKKTNFVVRYSGSPLKYSFDEANHEKGITLAEIDGEGKIFFENHHLIPKKDLKIISGTVEELQKFQRTEDYIFANVTDKNYILNAIDKLKNSAFPNILGINFTSLEQNMENVSMTKKFQENNSVLDNFEEFFKSNAGEDFTADYRKAMEKFLTDLEVENRN